MDFNGFIINKFVNCFYAKDPKGRKKIFENRKFACFIITLRGKICFTSGTKSIVTSNAQSVFLPQGLSYTNECLEDAESIVINFTTEKEYTEPFAISKVSQKIATECYKNLKKAANSVTPQSKMVIMKELYGIAAELFAHEESLSSADKILASASEYIMTNYGNCTLTVAEVAANCFVSEIYLRKLFEKKYNTTPFKMLTDIRMKKAYLLAKEKRPIKEIAEESGYSAVYQFSRAYKKYYGFPPSET